MAHRALFVLPFLLAACSVATSASQDHSSAAATDDEETSERTQPRPQKLEWPNTQSKATSDPWLAEHHDAITKMRPKVLAINFDNDPATRSKFKPMVEQTIASLAEGSRYHGYSDPNAEPFLEYEVAKYVDLADDVPPSGWSHSYSSKVRVDCSSRDFYNFDYAALLGDEYAGFYDIPDPDSPGRKLPLCDLYERGMVHEVWIYMNIGSDGPYQCADGKVAPRVGYAEILENKQVYDAENHPKPGKFERCAGNGCFTPRASQAFSACGRTVRVLYINSGRGNGCAVHSAGHGFEWMARSGAVPELEPRFEAFGNFDLDKKHGLPFSDWYACDNDDSCATFTGPNAVDWSVKGRQGHVEPFDQACGNVHFAPNSSKDYDENDTEVLSTCEHFGLKDGPDGKDAQEPFSRAKYARYQELTPDCGGAWQVYWRQSFPGLGNEATDADGKPMRNWWPYLFY